MKNRLALILSLSATICCAQLQFELSQNYMIPYAVNPAASGIENYLDLKMGTRMQWLKLENIVQTHYAGINVNWKILQKSTLENEAMDQYFAYGSRVGTSFFILQDKFSPFSNTHIQGAIAYHLPVTRGLFFSFSLGGSFQDLRLDGTSLNPRQTDDPVYLSLLQTNAQTNTNMNGGAMIYGKHFFMGYSQFSILEKREENVSTIHSGQVGVNLRVSPVFHLYLSGIGYGTLDNISWTANTKLRYKEHFWAGATYKSSKSVAGLVGFISKKLLINYSYEVTGASSRLLGTVHELSIGFTIRDYLNNRLHLSKPFFL